MKCVHLRDIGKRERETKWQNKKNCDVWVTREWLV